MSLPEQENQVLLEADEMDSSEMGFSAREFMGHCELEKERLLNSGEAFDEAFFDQAVELVMGKLNVLADEGWT